MIEDTKALDDHGALYIRKRRGKNMQFMVGGAVTLRDAANYVRWENVLPNTVIFFNSETTGLVGLVRPS